MIVKIRPKTEADEQKILSIVNSFVENSFAVYSEDGYPDSTMTDWNNNSRIFLVLEDNSEIIGFGFLSYYKKRKHFNHVGVLTYFILEEYTGKGLGSKLFNELIEQGKKLGITNFLAHISSKNERSLNFHKKFGFNEVGRFKNMSYKFGESLDVIWVQKQFHHEEKSV